MSHHRYLIVGGGMTADAAVRGIRSVDSKGSIAILGEEPDPPYDRPPLSKGLWKGGDEERIWRETPREGVKLRLGLRVVRIDPEKHTVTDERGGIHTWERLLLATGGTPRLLPDAPHQVIYFRTYRDYLRLRELVSGGGSVAVVGGGFIGSEIAAALAMNGVDVTLLFPEEGICRRILPQGLSTFLDRHYRERGVDVRPGMPVSSVRRHGEKLLVAVEGRDTLRVDGVVAGLGIEPNVVLAEGAGLEVDGGIVTDSRLRTRAPDIWAAGDVAAFWSPVLGKRLRVEHEDHANRSGTLAGRAMAGEDETYDYLPYFYSDLFETGYEAVGEISADMRIVEDWFELHRRGVLYYLRRGRVRGILLWNVRGRLGEARALIREGAKVSGADLRGRIRPRT